MVETYNFKNIRVFRFKLRGDKTCSLSNSYLADWREIRNKLAVVVWGNHDVGAEMDISLLPPRRCNEINTVYISQKSKIPRDLVRRTYKITLSPEKADLIVMPVLKEAFEMKYNYIAYDSVTKDAYIITFYRDYVHSEEKRCDAVEEANIKREALAKIMSGLPGTRFDDEINWLHDDGGLERKVFFISDYPEYHYILNNTYPGKKYIFDTNLVLEGGTDISVETLDVWRRIPRTDSQLFEKSILSSNWNKYPFTLCVFLEEMRRGWGGQQFMYLLNAINYYEFDFSSTSYPNEIQPDDWNMMQKYLLHKKDMSEEGGYDKDFNMEDLTYNSSDCLLRHRVVTRPFFIDKPMTLQKIKEAMKLSS